MLIDFWNLTFTLLKLRIDACIQFYDPCVTGSLHCWCRSMKQAIPTTSCCSPLWAIGERWSGTCSNLIGDYSRVLRQCANIADDVCSSFFFWKWRTVCIIQLFIVLSERKKKALQSGIAEKRFLTVQWND